MSKSTMSPEHAARELSNIIGDAFDDALAELNAAHIELVEAIRAGGTIEATAGIGSMKLEFEGDPAEAKPKKRKRHQRKAGSP